MTWRAARGAANEIKQTGRAKTDSKARPRFVMDSLHESQEGDGTLKNC
jgi:hypothetical protein